MALQSYRELIAWQKAMALVTEVYRETQDFPKTEVSGLTSQIRRSAISIPSNIAEGQGRLSTGEFTHLLGTARGSLLELETHLLIARNLGHLDESRIRKLLEMSAEVGRIVNGLISSLGTDR